MKNTNRTGRWIAIDNCLKTGHSFTWEQLAKACEDHPQVGYYPSKDMIKKDISQIRSEYGFEIIFNRLTNTYSYKNKSNSISNHGLLSSHTNLLLEAQTILSQYPFLPQLDGLNAVIEVMENKAGLKGTVNKKIIEFDNSTSSSGIEFLKPLYLAISNKNVVSFEYQPFHYNNSKTVLVHPYYLKEYNKRWFLIAYNDDNKRLENFALDRIQSSISCITIKYQECQTDFNDYFKDIIGVSIYEGKKERIELSLSGNRGKYVLTKKLHHSQETVINTKDEVVVVINVIPNLELYSLLLSFGSDLKVLSPKSVVKEINSIIKKMNSKNEFE
jgi:predicted DNA-binding transcriptional regulator YafY